MKKAFTSIFILIALLLTACGADTSTPIVEPVTDVLSATAVTAEGTLMPKQSAELSFAQGGVVKEVFVRSGERVSEGDVIVQLIGADSAKAELAAAQLEQTLAQQALDALYRNALQSSSNIEQALMKAQKAYESEANGWSLGNKEDATDLELSIEDYVTAEEDYRDAQKKLDDVLDLEESDHERKDAQEEYDTQKTTLVDAYADLKTSLAENDKSLDEETANLLSAISNLESARELQERLNTDNLDPEVLAAAQARLDAASAHVVAAEAAVELYELRAPFSGSLLSSDLTVGETVLPMTPVVFVADTSQWIVKTKDLAEVDVANVRVGDSATVKLDAFPNEEFTGTVTKVDPVGKLYLGDMTYQVTITLAEAESRFLWNMTAVVTINTDEG